MSENEKQSEQQQQPLPMRVALRDEPYYANCAMVQMTPFDVIVERKKNRSSQGKPMLDAYAAPVPPRAPPFDCHNYQECTLVPGTRMMTCASMPLEGSLGSGALGKITPVTDENGQGQVVEMYDRQIYLSHLQARALHSALTKSLSSLARAGRQASHNRLSRRQLLSRMRRSLDGRTDLS
ncbi:MAG: hypothetical protein V1792_03425 [Pseudomonadota bacterium]